MDELIAIFVEDKQTGGQTGFKFFELYDEDKAMAHKRKVADEIRGLNVSDKWKVREKTVKYDRKRNVVSM